MDFSQIQEIIRMVSKHKLTEFILKEGDFKLVVRNQPSSEGAPAAAPVMIPAAPPVAAAPPAPAPPVAPAPPAPAAPAASAPSPAPAASAEEARYIPIKSPMVGTFYRSSAPDKPPFIKVGDSVDTGTPVCIIEAMKLFNEIESDVKGKVVKIVAEDASPVEYDAVLFLVDPA